MRRLMAALLVAGLCGVGLLAWTDGPLTPLMNLAGRTDSNGYLMVSGGTPGAAQTPLTPLANLRGRTDENGYLRVALSGGSGLFGDGAVGAPSVGFASQSAGGGTGLYMNSTAMATTRLGVLQGQWPGGGGYDLLGQTAQLRFGTSADTVIARTALGNISLGAAAIGVTLKADVLPTASTCGTSPAVTAGSTPLAGSINVGTGTPASCIVTFGGTAFPSNPFCTANVETATAGTVRALGVSATTTALTITPATAFVASTVVNWHCISSK